MSVAFLAPAPAPPAPPPRRQNDEALRHKPSGADFPTLPVDPAAASAPSSAVPTAAAPSAAAVPSGNRRMYRLEDNKWVTRDIAALDFLLGIPLQREAEIVASGWSLLQRQQQQHYDGGDGDDSKDYGDDVGAYLARNAPRQQRWWEKWVRQSQGGAHDASGPENPVTASEMLERPTQEEKGGGAMLNRSGNPVTASKNLLNYAPPGRRLEGDKATLVRVPVTTREFATKQKSVARAAALREWELRTAHGLTTPGQPPLLDGRVFFSSGGGYPMAVFSLLRYEPRKEEAALRRQKLEARGGGGSQYVIPQRDWRGVSYRALLPRARAKDHNFNRFVGAQHQGGDDDTAGSESSDESDVYIPGLLDDPGMVLGRHRTVMVGDRVTGPIITSTIQFVEPSLLKSELNKQFRERFDGWEPPRAARRYIGARVVDGVYTLMDPGAADNATADDRSIRTPRQGSVASVSTASVETGGGGAKEKQIRMPPSLTLSKIRSLKNQALHAALKAKLEIGTVALACVYFERLCLDCRVDKSNRKLSMAACLLLASKVNESHMALVDAEELDPGKSRRPDVSQSAASSNSATPNTNNFASKIHPVARSTKRGNTMFASLLEYFTEEWSLSLKNLFAAEWGVFAALGFSLLAEPSQVAFHFKRFMKTLELNPRRYLGEEMYDQWQEALHDEEFRRQEREHRHEMRRQQKEQELMNLHLELEKDRMRRLSEHDDALSGDGISEEMASHRQVADNSRRQSLDPSPGKLKKPGIGILHRLGMRRTASSEAIHLLAVQSEHQHRLASLSSHVRREGGNDPAGLSHSPSLPNIANAFPTASPGSYSIDVPRGDPDSRSDTSSIGSADENENRGAAAQ